MHTLVVKAWPRALVVTTSAAATLCSSVTMVVAQMCGSAACRLHRVGLGVAGSPAEVPSTRKPNYQLLPAIPCRHSWPLLSGAVCCVQVCPGGA